MKNFFTICLLVMVTGYISAQTTIFSENFDSYTAGQTVNSQQPLLYPWTGAAAENAYVSSEQAYSTSNSMKVVNNNDMLYNFNSKTSGEYDIKLRMFITSGQGAYFNVEHAFGTEWAFSFYFKSDSTGNITQGGTPTNFNYIPETWLYIEMKIDLENDQATAWIDGTQIAQWTFSNTEEATGGQNKLDVIDFYGLNTASTGVSSSTYYVDNFEFIEVVSGLTPPNIDISTTPITTQDTADIILPFSNTGEEDMLYSSHVSFNDPSLTSTLTDGFMNYNVGSASAIGWANSFEVYAGVRFLPEMTATHVGQQIVSATISINDAPLGDSITVYVWEKGGFITPGTSTILAQKTATVMAASDNTVVFDTPVTITGDEIWIGYKFTTPASGYTLGTDDAALTPHTSYLRTGPVWTEFEGVSSSGTGNFGIIADVVGAGWPVWLSVSPSNGTVTPSGSQNLTLNFNTTDLVTGTYEATVNVGCNDITQEWTEIPVTLTYSLGIDDISKIGFMTYPNPSTGFINVVSDHIIKSVSIYNLDGKIVKCVNINETRTIIETNNIAKGNYIMEIISDDNTSTKRNITIQ